MIAYNDYLMIWIIFIDIRYMWSLIPWIQIKDVRIFYVTHRWFIWISFWASDWAISFQDSSNTASQPTYRISLACLCKILNKWLGASWIKQDLFDTMLQGLQWFSQWNWPRSGLWPIFRQHSFGHVPNYDGSCAVATFHYVPLRADRNTGEDAELIPRQVVAGWCFLIRCVYLDIPRASKMGWHINFMCTLKGRGRVMLDTPLEVVEVRIYGSWGGRSRALLSTQSLGYGHQSIHQDFLYPFQRTPMAWDGRAYIYIIIYHVLTLALICFKHF